MCYNMPHGTAQHNIILDTYSSSALYFPALLAAGTAATAAAAAAVV